MRARRRLLEQRYHFLYSWLPEWDRYVCFYCGMPADTADHCPPLTYVDAAGTESLEADGIDLLLVPCCRECNSILGDSMLLHPLDRRERVKKTLREKYARVLEYKSFSRAELRQFGPNLRRECANATRQKDILLQRINWGAHADKSEEIGVEAGH